MGFRVRLFLILLCSLSGIARPADDWPPISPEELQITSEPKAPGAPAIFLYRKVDRDDTQNREYNYARIKILTEEGRQYANVELPFWKGHGDVKDIQARTIHRDGSIVIFDGNVFEKTLIKGKGVNLLVKAFALPDVQVGSIIEYRYKRTFEEGYVFNSSWLLSESLFTKQASFSLRYSSNHTVEWMWPNGLPQGTQPPKDDHNLVHLEVENIPAFVAEDYMPPEDEMKYRVEFTYTGRNEKNPEKYWTQQGRVEYAVMEAFVNRRKAMEQAVSQIISPADSPETKLRKIYARTQEVHNVSFEREKTQQEARREKPPAIATVEDVWKLNYGDHWAVSRLFVALARAAGFEATLIMISPRSDHFFDKRLMNSRELTSSLVALNLNGHPFYLDPGTPFTPFGLLPWYKTAVPGLRLDKDGGSWITTPELHADDSRTERTASLQLTDDGSLEGTVTITYTGIEALWRRHYERDEDDQTRSRFLEDELKSYIPVTADANLMNRPDWNSAAPSLTAKFSVTIRSWVSAAGHRSLMPVGIFGGNERHTFEHAQRTYPIYFNFPYQTVDHISIALPPSLKITSIPPSRTIDVKACVYNSTASNLNNTLELTRELTVNLGYAEAKYYAALRNFFQNVRAEDEQPAVLSVTSSTSDGDYH
jgi:hypothetical protein